MSLAVVAVFALLAAAPGAMAAEKAALNSYQVGIVHVRDGDPIAGYCDGGDWYEFWTVDVYAIVYRYDEDGSYHREATTGEFTIIERRYAAPSCNDGMPALPGLEALAAQPSDTAAERAAIPVYDVRKGYSHDIQKVAGYCLSARWYEVWEVHDYIAVGYYDNSGTWNEDYRYDHVPNVQTRYAGSCNDRDAIGLELPGTDVLGPEETDHADS